MSNRIRWRCRRGMLELDFIFERFFNTHFAALSEEEKTAFETLLAQEDPLLFDWLVTGLPCSEATLLPIIKKIQLSEKSA